LRPIAISAKTPGSAEITRGDTVVADLSSARWQKSSQSMGSGDCVEVAFLPSGDVALRDAKDGDGAVLVFSASQGGAFVTGMKDGEFDAGGH